MPNNEKEYYYAGEKKIKLKRLTDSFAVKYKPSVTSRAMERKLARKADFADAEERKELPKHRIVIVTLPPARRSADVGKSMRTLEEDGDVEFVAPVYMESQSGLRMVATDEITVRFKSGASQADVENFNDTNDVEVVEKNRFVPNQYLLRVKNPADTLSVANRYQESDLTEFAEPNFITEFKKAFLPNDEFIANQWHLHNTGQGGGLAGEAWGLYRLGKLPTDRRMLR